MGRQQDGLARPKVRAPKAAKMRIQRGCRRWLGRPVACSRSDRLTAEAPELVLRLGTICLSENAEDGKMLSTGLSGPNCARRYPA